MKTIALLLGPTAAILCGAIFYFATANVAAALTSRHNPMGSGVWIFEPIPIPVTSLLPMALLPMFGIISAKELGAAYGNPLKVLMLGGFLIATALAQRRPSPPRSFYGAAIRR